MRSQGGRDRLAPPPAGWARLPMPEAARLSPRLWRGANSGQALAEAVSQGGAPSGKSPVEEIGGEKPRWGRMTLLLIFLILLILLLLALFWPVKKELKKGVKPATALKGQGITGQTRYRVISAKKTLELGGAHTVNWILIVTFELENLANKPRILDYSHVKLIDDINVEHSPSPGLTGRLYDLSKKKSPWELNIYPGNPLEVQVIFAISEAPRKYNFAGRDLNWRSTKFIKLPLFVEEKKK